jgi:branched-chain amino acid aminotransferase
MPIRININGVITGPEEAQIPVLDRGFLFGDSIYEALRTYDKKPFLFSRHYARLERSARGIGLDLPYTRDEALRQVRRTIREASNPGESRIRLMVTRGVSDLTPSPKTRTDPRTVIIVSPLNEIPSTVYTDGVDIVISSFKRGSQLSDIKTGSLIQQVLAYRDAEAANAAEAILTTPEGHLSDGITSNIFLVRAGTVLTPSREANILEGITRSVVIELARNMGFQVIEGLFGLDALQTADEMFLTSTTREVVPVVRVDGRTIGRGQPGTLTRQLLEAYRSEVRRLLAEDPQDG